jgi:hypothetical protein
LHRLLYLVAHAHPVQRFDGSGGNGIAARLVAGKLVAIEKEDIVSLLDQDSRRRGSGRASTYNNDVVFALHDLFSPKRVGIQGGSWKGSDWGTRLTKFARASLRQ